MKLRQKLAIVLASAMIITAVPVVTSAASTNGFNKTVSMVEGTALTTTSAVNLDMSFEAVKGEKPQTTTFFVDGQDFEFNANEYKIKANASLSTADEKAAVKTAKEALATAEKNLADNKVTGKVAEL
ncbi:MAG: hypothetical protein RR817_00385, partial [Niameybacter sp.]